MTAFTASLSKSEDGLGAVQAATVPMMTRLRKQLTRVEFDNGTVAAERGRIASNSVGIFQNGEDLASIFGEVGYRTWSLASGGTDAQNAANSHARTINFGNGILYVTASDANVAVLGLPSSGVGTANGDLGVVWGTGIFLRTAGQWPSTPAIALGGAGGVQSVAGKTGVVTLANADVSGSLGTAAVGAANGVAGLDSSGKVPTTQLPAAVLGALNYQTVWNASTNTPALVSGVGTKGWYYKVSVAGSTPINGISQWNVGDSIVFDGTVWDKIDGISNEIVSVAGLVGVVAAAPLKAALAITPTDVAGFSAAAAAVIPIINDLVTGGAAAALSAAQGVALKGLVDSKATDFGGSTLTGPTILYKDVHGNRSILYRGTLAATATLTFATDAQAAAAGHALWVFPDSLDLVTAADSAGVCQLVTPDGLTITSSGAKTIGAECRGSNSWVVGTTDPAATTSPTVSLTVQSAAPTAVEFNFSIPMYQGSLAAANALTATITRAATGVSAAWPVSSFAWSSATKAIATMASAMAGADLPQFAFAEGTGPRMLSLGGNRPLASFSAAPVKPVVAAGTVLMEDSFPAGAATLTGRTPNAANYEGSVWSSPGGSTAAVLSGGGLSLPNVTYIGSRSLYTVASTKAFTLAVTFSLVDAANSIGVNIRDNGISNLASSNGRSLMALSVSASGISVAQVLPSSQTTVIQTIPTAAWGATPASQHKLESVMTSDDMAQIKVDGVSVGTPFSLALLPGAYSFSIVNTTGTTPILVSDVKATAL